MKKNFFAYSIIVIVLIFNCFLAADPLKIIKNDIYFDNNSGNPRQITFDPNIKKVAASLSKDESKIVLSTEPENGKDAEIQIIDIKTKKQIMSIKRNAVLNYVKNTYWKDSDEIYVVGNAGRCDIFDDYKLNSQLTNMYSFIGNNFSVSPNSQRMVFCVMKPGLHVELLSDNVAAADLEIRLDKKLTDDETEKICNTVYPNKELSFSVNQHTVLSNFAWIDDSEVAFIDYSREQKQFKMVLIKFENQPTDKKNVDTFSIKEKVLNKIKTPDSLKIQINDNILKIIGYKNENEEFLTRDLN